MSTNKILGLVLIIIGIVLTVYGYDLSNSFIFKMEKEFEINNNTPYIFIFLGISSLVIGLVVLLKSQNNGS